MIECSDDSQPGCGHILMRPNAAMPWRYNLYVIAIFSVGVLGFGIFWTFQGVTLALPFGVLEMLALSAALYHVARQAQRQQTLRLTPTEVHFKSGLKVVEQDVSTPRQWTHIDIRPAKRKMEAPRVFLVFREQQIEVGGFLNRRDRYRLIRQLKRWVNGPARLAPPQTH